MSEWQGSNAIGQPYQGDKMVDYDALPRPIRDALKVAPGSFAPADVALSMRKRGMAPFDYAIRMLEIVFPAIVEANYRKRGFADPQIMARKFVESLG